MEGKGKRKPLSIANQICSLRSTIVLLLRHWNMEMHKIVSHLDSNHAMIPFFWKDLLLAVTLTSDLHNNAHLLPQ
ncbi:hypothetical protein KSP40_PGU001014 [Platanthera guangdongensis]|uniref:Uncharacterized protein n=1 Tax=Platanthera guangdongensis TaxID=2320717 RepID=A0ABR2LW45_9ASPA